MRKRIHEWTLRWGSTLVPWSIAAVAVAIADYEAPGWSLSVLQLAIGWLSLQRLTRQLVPRMLAILAVLAVLPYGIRAVSDDPSPAFEPLRLWVLIALACAGFYHFENQKRRRRRLAIRQQLQRRVRRRAVQIRRINEALRREIARRQATQQKLDRTETHLQSLALRMQLQVLRKDIDGVITYANEAFCRGVGRSADEVIGSTDADLYNEALAHAYRLDDERVIESGEAVDHIESHPLPDGRTGWVQVFKAPEYDDQNRIIGIQMVFWDVTDSYRKTAELRRSEARKRALFDAAREAVLLVDDAGVVVEANPAAETLLSLGGKVLPGRKLDEIAVPEGALAGGDDELAPIRPPERGAAVGAGTGNDDEKAPPQRPLRWSDLPHGQRREIVLRPIGEANFPAEVSVHPIPLENSFGLAIFIRDVTLRHRAVAALQQAKIAAEEASRIKSEFMASVSHEIRTPLGGITGSAELLAQMNLPPKARQYVEMIRHSGNLLSRVIGDILDLASIEAGRLQIEPEPTDLHRCVGEAFRSLATRAMGKDLEMVLSIHPEVPRKIEIDANRLRQIVINLAGNSIKFTPRGHVMLKVGIHEGAVIGLTDTDDDRVTETDSTTTPTPRRWLQLEMVDSGIGIAKDRLSKIFEPFEQGDSGMTRRFGGTGLGLSISDQLVRRMGGTIHVISRVGHGSTFRCFIPLVAVESATAADGAAPAVDQASPTARSETADRGNADAVTQIDDSAANTVALDIPHPVQRRAIAELLEAHGYRITADAAIRIVDQASPTSPRPINPRYRWQNPVSSQPRLNQPSKAGRPKRAKRAAAKPSTDGKGPSGNSPSSNSSPAARTIWLARVDEPNHVAQSPTDPVLLKPILPDDLLTLLRGSAAEAMLVSSRQAPSTVDDRAWSPISTPPQDRSTEPSGASSSGQVPPPHERAKLLLVDDSPVNQAVIRDFLVAAGYRVDVVASGEEAIIAARSGRYACVLMDLQMPGMDGVEAMQRMVEQDAIRELRSPPFLALTAHATEEHRRRCLDQGMKAFLVKPIDRRTLLTAVAEQIDAAGEVAAAEADPGNFAASLPAAGPVGDVARTADGAKTADGARPADGASDFADNESLSDWQRKLLRSVGGEPEIAESLVEAFLNEVPQLCDDLTSAFDNADGQLVRRASHTLKSCLKYVAEEPDWRLAERIELAAREDDLDTARQSLAPLLETARRWIRRVSGEPDQLPPADEPQP